MENLKKKCFDYKIPEWAAMLHNVPKKRIRLAHLNTPIETWDLKDIPPAFKVSIKRDDMTGSTLTGNKSRKLEFLLADAIDKNCNHIMTCGAVQSNHVRSTVIAATQLGLKSHAFLLSKGDKIELKANLLLNKMCGANLHTLPWDSEYDDHILPCMRQLAEEIRIHSNEESYFIGFGGSDLVGMFGYIEAFDELVKQGVLTNFDDVVFTTGSGGTAAGLAIGNYLTGRKLKMHAISVSENSDYHHNHINQCLDKLNIAGVRSEDIIDIIDDYVDPGYAVVTQECLDFLTKTSASTGIILDPVYTAKCALGMVNELNKNPSRFKGTRILFIHTGGMFGLFNDVLENYMPNNLKQWEPYKETSKL